METKGPRKYNQGIWGWLSGGRYGVERKLYILHRLSGIALIFYLPLHVYVTSVRVRGGAEWESAMEMLHHPIFVLGEYLLFAAFTFHALNGLRLALTELGFFLGEAGRPIYPPTSSVQKQRPLVWITMIIAAVVLAAAGYDFLM